MAKHITTWSPDTCGCVVDYEWDDAVPAEQRVHTFAGFQKKCADHEGLDADHIHFGHLMDENQSKNIMHNHFIQDHPRLSHEVIDSEGNRSKDFAPGHSFKWHFTGKNHERKLHVDVHGTTLTPAEKQKAKDFAKTLKKPIEVA